jgi:hypothetical protein
MLVSAQGCQQKWRKTDFSRIGPDLQVAAFGSGKVDAAGQ